MTRRLRIGFDGTLLRAQRSGVGIYTECLLEHLAPQHPEADFILISNRPIDAPRLLAMPNVRPAVFPGSFPPRMLWVLFRWALKARTLGLDLAHFTNYLAPLVCPVPYVSRCTT